MRTQNFESVLKIRVPAQLVAHLKRTAAMQARTVPDIVRQACVSQLASLGTPYRPNDNGEAPLEAA